QRHRAPEVGHATQSSAPWINGAKASVARDIEHHLDLQGDPRECLDRAAGLPPGQLTLARAVGYFRLSFAYALGPRSGGNRPRARPYSPRKCIRSTGTIWA